MNLKVQICLKCGDILFPNRSPSPDPTPTSPNTPKWTRNGPETDPKWTQTDMKRTQNGPKRTQNGPKSRSLGWDGRGVCRDWGGVGGCKGKRKSLLKWSTFANRETFLNFSVGTLFLMLCVLDTNKQNLLKPYLQRVSVFVRPPLESCWNPEILETPMLLILFSRNSYNLKKADNSQQTPKHKMIIESPKSSLKPLKKCSKWSWQNLTINLGQSLAIKMAKVGHNLAWQHIHIKTCMTGSRPIPCLHVVFKWPPHNSNSSRGSLA